MNRTFKYRIYANKSTSAKMEKWISFCRQLYNLALEQRIQAYKTHQKSISKFQQMREVTELRRAFSDYNEINSSVLCNVIKRLDRAYSSFFRRIKLKEKAGFPRFKNVNRYNSITFRDGWKLKGKYLNITKVGIFKIKLSRPILGDIQEVIIKKSNDKFYVSFCCKNVPQKILPKTNNEIAIDVGCESFLTDSNNRKVINPRFFKQTQKKLTKLQQSFSRKKRFSNRRKKQKIIIAKKHQKIFNQRQDFHYKVANQLIKKYGVIYIEKLNSWTSWRSLNRSMRDVAWFQFFDILRFKAEEAGRDVVEVPAKNTSKMCSACGEIVPKDLSCRIHSCSCGLKIDRDYNAALNILKLGQSSQLVPS